MQLTDWPLKHSDLLREHLKSSMSYSEIADAINAKFKTAYSRSAVIGRTKRLGLARPSRLKGRPSAPQKPPRSPIKAPERATAELTKPVPITEQAEPVKLRCVGIAPRLLSISDLEPGDCRYPYGGDAENEPILFCAHPRRPGSSYCTPHFHLTLGPGTASERAASPVPLRLVTASDARTDIGFDHHEAQNERPFAPSSPRPSARSDPQASGSAQRIQRTITDEILALPRK